MNLIMVMDSDCIKTENYYNNTKTNETIKSIVAEFNKTYLVTVQPSFFANKSLTQHSSIKIIPTVYNKFLHTFFSLSPFLCEESFCIITRIKNYNQTNISEFLQVSNKYEAYDGVFSISKSDTAADNKYVSLNEDDVILKISDSGLGYNWGLAGLYFFNCSIFEEMSTAIEQGITTYFDFIKLLIRKGYSFKASISKF